jgi:DNA-binding SARP family transcriptional activator
VLLFLAGPPVGLWWAFGNPLERLPTRQQLWEWLTRSDDLVTPAALMGALLWAAWLIWAAAALAMVAELIAVATRWRLPALRLPAPLHRLVFGLAGTAAITLTSTGRAGAAPPVAEVGTGAAPAVAVAVPDQVEQGPATIHVGEKRYVYVVKRRDTLSKISKEWLGDADRWPEICKLNWHRHWPKGGVLRDCDLIYPGWDLRLPADATPPASARPKRPPAPPTQAPLEPPLSVSPPQPTPEVSTPAEDPDGVTEAPATTSPSTAPAVDAPATPAHPDRSPTTTDPPNPAGAAPRSTPPADERGVSLSGGSFVTWSLAAAITAAAALVWLQRRRRYVPGRDESDLAELPPPVVELQRQIARHRPDKPASEDLAERAAAVPALPTVQPGGVGLHGDGAPAAARAALVSALASGGPHDPDRRGEVVIDRTTLTTLFGEDADTLGPWSRLHVADDLDDGLANIEPRLLHRARVLDEHSLTDLDTLRERVPDEEPFPPVLLICHTPPPAQSTRARVTLGLGGGLDVSALLLGEWAHGPTIDVAADGRTRPIDGPPVDGISERVDVLDAKSALAILATLREAHTGQAPQTITIPKQRTPDRPTPPTPPRTDDAAQETATGRGASGPPVPDSQEQVTRASLRVLGSPRIENITLPGRPLRGKAAELAVYLACHPDGADTRTIGEHLAPESRLRQADQQIHTNASNLRHVLGRAAGPRPGGYVLKRGANARYRLDPTIDVDLWQLRDLLGRAQLASAVSRTQLLRQACDLYTEPLADGCDYEWVEPHREKVRRLGTEAHLLLADELLATDPHAAAELLEKAIGLDRYNEELYRKAMHARHALHDPDGIRSLLRALAKALSDLDTEPAESTVELATQLRANLKEH